MPNEVLEAIKILHTDLANRFDKLEEKFDEHVESDRLNFDRLSDDLRDTKETVDGVKSTAKWTIRTVIGAAVVWVFTKIG